MSLGTDRNNTFEVKLYAGSYIWDSDSEKDITNEVVMDTFVLTRGLTSSTLIDFRLRNDEGKFTEKSSKYYISKGNRIKVTIGSSIYKMIVITAPLNKNDIELQLKCASQMYEMNEKFCQIRAVPRDGYYYVEDVIYRALYDAGMQNFIRIKRTDGVEYNEVIGPITKMNADDQPVFIRIKLLDLVNDVCNRTGTAWIEENYDDDQTTTLKLIDLNVDFEAESSQVIETSNYHDNEVVEVTKDISNMVNLIYFDTFPVVIRDMESIMEYSVEKAKRISVPENADAKIVVEYSRKFLDIMKNPTMSIAVTRLVDEPMSNLDYFLKVTNRIGGYDTSLGVDRKYRITKSVYNLGSKTENITAGNEHRNMITERLLELMKVDSTTDTSVASMQIAKYDNVRLQIYTDGGYIDSDPGLASVDDLFGGRIGVDRTESTVVNYVYNAIYYWDADGISTIN